MPEQKGQHGWSFNLLCLGGPETLAAARFFEIGQPDGWLHNRVARDQIPVFDAVVDGVIKELGADFEVHHDPAFSAAFKLIDWVNARSNVLTGLEIGDKAREIAAMARAVPETGGDA